MIQPFSRISPGDRFEARACTARQDHCLLAKYAGDLVTSEKGKIIPS